MERSLELTRASPARAYRRVEGRAPAKRCAKIASACGCVAMVCHAWRGLSGEVQKSFRSGTKKMRTDRRAYGA